MKLFDFFSEEANKLRAINLFKKLHKDEGFKLLKKVSLANVAHLKDLLVEDVDDDGERLTEEARIEVRMLIKAYTEVSNAPQFLYNKLSGESLKPEKEENLDPFPVADLGEDSESGESPELDDDPY